MELMPDQPSGKNRTATAAGGQTVRRPQRIMTNSWNCFCRSAV